MMNNPNLEDRKLLLFISFLATFFSDIKFIHHSILDLLPW